MQKKLKWHTEQRKVNELIPYEHNPRVLLAEEEKKLRQSLAEFDLVEIPVIDLQNKIISGHQRMMLMVALGRGEEIIDVRVSNRDLTEVEFKRYNITANVSSGSWDIEILRECFPDIELKGLGVDLSKIEMPKINEQLENSDEVQVIVEVKNVLIKRGDIFQINGHRVMCGDSKNKIEVGKLMDGKLAQMIFIDPPYNVKIDSIVNLGKTQHKNFKEGSGEMSELEFIDFLKSIFKNLCEFSKDGSLHFICMDWKHIFEMMSAGRACYTEMKQLCIWNKENAGMGTFYRSKHELIFVFKKGTAKHINNFELGQYGRYRTNVWDYAGATNFKKEKVEGDRRFHDDGNIKHHPTVKSMKMIADAMLDCSKKGNLILDLCLGSGTTLIAAECTDRICNAMEIDEKYLQTSIVRYANYMRQLNREIKLEHLNGELTLEKILKNL